MILPRIAYKERDVAGFYAQPASATPRCKVIGLDRAETITLITILSLSIFLFAFFAHWRGKDVGYDRDEQARAKKHEERRRRSERGTAIPPQPNDPIQTEVGGPTPGGGMNTGTVPIQPHNPVQTGATGVTASGGLNTGTNPSQPNDPVQTGVGGNVQASGPSHQNVLRGNEAGHGQQIEAAETGPAPGGQLAHEGPGASSQPPANPTELGAASGGSQVRSQQGAVVVQAPTGDAATNGPPEPQALAHSRIGSALQAREQRVASRTSHAAGRGQNAVS